MVITAIYNMDLYIPFIHCSITEYKIKEVFSKYHIGEIKSITFIPRFHGDLNKRAYITFNKWYFNNITAYNLATKISSNKLGAKFIYDDIHYWILKPMRSIFDSQILHNFAKQNDKLNDIIYLQKNEITKLTNKIASYESVIFNNIPRPILKREPPLSISNNESNESTGAYIWKDDELFYPDYKKNIMQSLNQETIL
jgi:hypothetical protein